MTTATMTRNGQVAQVSAWGSLYQMLMDALHGVQYRVDALSNLVRGVQA